MFLARLPLPRSLSSSRNKVGLLILAPESKKEAVERACAPGRREDAPLCYEFHADFDIIHHLRNAMGFAFPPIRGLGSPPAPERASRLRSRREIPQSFQFGFTLFLAASRRWCSCHSFYKRSCGERERGSPSPSL